MSVLCDKMIILCLLKGGGGQLDVCDIRQGQSRHWQGHKRGWWRIEKRTATE